MSGSLPTKTKLARTALSAFMVTLHVLTVPAQLLLHPPNVDSAAGLAVSATADADSYVVEHAAPQMMLAGVLVTVPTPDPERATPSVYTGNVWEHSF